MVVLAMITKNSVSRMKQTPVSFEDVLRSTLQVPYKSFILVDASSDETPNVVKKFCDEYGKELILIRGGRTRGEARQIAIRTFLENFSDNWLMFLDDDVVLEEGWWDEAKQYINDPTVGLIWGPAWYTGVRKVFLNRYYSILGYDERTYILLMFLMRGSTHDILVRRQCLEDISIPEDAHMFEDGIILRHVMSKGYKIAILQKGGYHYRPSFFRYDFKLEEDVKHLAYLAVKYGFERPTVKRFLKVLLFMLPLSLAVGASLGLKGLKLGWEFYTYRVKYHYYLLKYSRRGRKTVHLLEET